MTKLSSIARISAIAGLLIAQSGCTGYSAANSTGSVGNAENTNPYMQAQIQVTITDSNNNVIFPAASGSTAEMAADTPYTLNLNVANAPAGTTYSLTYTNIDVVGATPTTITLTAGDDNTFSVPAQGDYSLQVVASATGYTPQTETYQVPVSCASPTFTATSLNASAIAVSSGSSPNFYNYSASAVIAGANGTAPYQCAWDPTGTGIVDSSFGDCSTPVSLYSNYVSARNVGLIVKDACNTTYEVTNVQTLSYTEPSMPGSDFIYGVTSNATGNAATDSRVENVTYLANNMSTNPIVSTQYGSGNFDIWAWQNYHEGSSVQFGVQIKITGLVETTPIDVSTMTGAVSASSATIQSVEYVTDQAGDQEPSETFLGSAANCTLSNQGANVQFVQGQPCTGGTSGDQNNATVEVWGHYVCTVMNGSGSAGTFTFTGDFDGAYNIADGCSGGGQGGGTQPPGF